MSLSRCLPLLILLTACSAPVHDDQDGDGVPAALDCDDTDPDIYPDREEIPYDGIDNGCRGFDAIDLDADGYAGVPFAVYAQRLDLPETLVVWPSSVSRTQVDCDDFLVQVHPNAREDQPYDGIDQDCRGDNDFDVDRDGQMPSRIRDEPTLPHVLAYMERWPHVEPIDVDAPDAWGDCDDFDGLVNTLAGDVPYDGKDSNCDGTNDFDQDGDGFYPAELHESFLAYVQATVPHEAPWGPSRWAPPGEAHTLPGDCVDQPIAILPQIHADQVHPHAADPWYDGIDSNCDGANDFDQDGDGFHSDADHQAWEDFLWMWTLIGTSPAFSESGDCDDLNPFANPLGTEWAFDGIDGDCDGGENATPFHFGRVAWTDPGALQLATSPQGFIAAITAGARNPIYSSEPDLENPGIAMVFPANPTSQGPDAIYHWGGELEKGDARLVTWEGGFATANLAPSPDPKLMLQEWTWDGTRYVGSAGAIHPVAGEAPIGLASQDAGSTASWCGASPSTFDVVGPSLADPFCPEGTIHGSLQILTGTGLTVVDGAQSWNFFDGETIESGDAVWSDGELLVVAVIDEGPRRVVRWGATSTPDAGLTSYALPIFDTDPIFEHEPTPGCSGLACSQGRTLDPTSVAIEAGHGRILFMVSAQSLDVARAPQDDEGPLPQDAVGWAVLNR